MRARMSGVAKPLARMRGPATPTFPARRGAALLCWGLSRRGAMRLCGERLGSVGMGVRECGSVGWARAADACFARERGCVTCCVLFSCLRRCSAGSDAALYVGVLPLRCCVRLGYFAGSCYIT